MQRDFTWGVIEKDMEGLARRFQAVSRNIANSNTPGYARRNVSFEDQLRDVINSGKKLRMTVTHPAHIPGRPLYLSDVTPVETKIVDEQYRLDRNNVDPEREMAVLGEARMMYSAMSRFAAKKLSGYRSVITGR
ncbi:MAG: flagellar basal body rod protein FlgB [Fretibacterium sp.]|nr:flagellar basal body rod protein FlgB [Fretibacterium sp.]